MPAPYPVAQTNHLYQLLFCDQPELFRPAAGSSPSAWQQLLLAPGGDAAAVRALANDPSQESRVRALAFGWLRAQRQPVPAGELLGSVVEVEMNGGIDVLAAYVDGRVRFINHSGRMVFLDTPVPAINPLLQAWMSAARSAAASARPWQRTGAAVPGAGRVRMSFLRSDGLHAVEGSFDALQRDARVGPALLAASQVLAATTRVVQPPAGGRPAT